MRQGSSRAEGRGVPPAGLPQLYTALFMLYFAPALLVPVLPPYLEAMGLGPAAVGAVVGALGAARAPVVLIAGPLAEALGRRTALALGAAAAAAGALTLLTKDLPLILAGRVAAGVFGALAAPAIWSLISEAGGGRGRAISIANAVTAAAGVAALAAGGYTAAVFGYEAAVAASALLTLSVIPLSRAAPPDPRRPLGEALRRLPAAARGAGRYAVVFALEWYMLYSLLALLPLYVKRLGYGEEVAGQLLAFEALVYAACQPLVGYVIDRHRGVYALMPTTALAYGAALAYIPHCRDPAQLAAALAAVAAASAPITPTAMARAAERSPPPRAAPTAVLFAAGNVGMALGPAVSGWLAQTSYQLAYLHLAAPAAAVAALAIYDYADERIRTPRTKPDNT